MNIRFDDKVVIVTGATHGYGRAISQAFSERGAKVWACDILEDSVKESAQLCQNAKTYLTLKNIECITEHDLLAEICLESLPDLFRQALSVLS